MEELPQIDLHDWHELRRKERAVVIARVTASTCEGLILETADWHQQIATNPLKLERSRNPRLFKRVTIERHEDGFAAISIDALDTEN